MRRRREHRDGSLDLLARFRERGTLRAVLFIERLQERSPVGVGVCRDFRAELLPELGYAGLRSRCRA